MPSPVRVLTTEYDGFSNTLKNQILVHQAFDPAGEAVPPGFKFVALWDTGATNCVISQNVVDACGLSPISYTTVYHADGESEAEVYLVAILLPEAGAGFPFIRATKGNLSGMDVLIGMDIIGGGDFAVSNANGKTVFTYRNPSMARIDFMAGINARKNLERNAPCPCNSGRKHKHCCGKP